MGKKKKMVWFVIVFLYSRSARWHPPKEKRGMNPSIRLRIPLSPGLYRWRTADLVDFVTP